MTMIRSQRETVVFSTNSKRRTFLPAGSYEVITEEELMEGLSFPYLPESDTLIDLDKHRGMAAVVIANQIRVY